MQGSGTMSQGEMGPPRLGARCTEARQRIHPLNYLLNTYHVPGSFRPRALGMQKINLRSLHLRAERGEGQAAARLEFGGLLPRLAAKH